MTDELLPFYNRELSDLRSLAADFAEAHPKIAGRLRLGADTVEDPHVSRLIESVAFMNARVRQKLDDDFPELTESLLNVLYPHYLAPIPSMTIVQFECDRELTGCYSIPAGTALETDRIHKESCYFQTVYPVDSWPIDVEAAELQGPPFDAPVTPSSKACAGLLHLVLRTQIESVTLSELSPRSLRFFLRGDSARRFDLYELLMNDLLGIAIAESPHDPAPRVLPASAIRAVGFGPDEGLLPYSKRSLPGYRLLTDYFAFPNKYLFFDLEGVIADREVGSSVHVFFYLRRTSDDLEHYVRADAFALNCAPVVNLFSKRAEPIRVDHASSSYHVVADARRPRSTEIYSVDKVTLTGPEGPPTPVLPFFGLRPLRREGTRAYWASSRRSTLRSDGHPAGGDEVTLSLVDPDLRVADAPDGVLSVEVTCFNRDVPHRLPFGGDQPRLRFVEGGGPIRRLRCLTPPTKPIRRSRRDGAMWQLVSHLSLNHLSITDGDDGTRAFQEILRLHDPSSDPGNRNAIEGILAVVAKPKVMRVLSGGIPGACRGLEVTIRFEESRFADTGLFLFASVLRHFLALYCSINTFVQVVATSTERKGEIRRWAPSTGTKDLL